ncbi:TlpA family protein disulfide reductase [Paenibacillus sp. CAA11]|uniref:TlpA family protein disulfide reductase n=1 Tax=Paenibacillus sp. CAA11 TaxID=1532905 RepID=UPI000D3BEDBF|nr:TlpA disulfide reductase family protein [Paenibacillus sp. CAA11]AWB44167.1 TlpA family protein disulfide reductase [Paenibacillus sp. CAA11]
MRMRRNMRSLFVLQSLVILLLVSTLQLFPICSIMVRASGKIIKTGDKAPTVSMESLDGQVYKLGGERSRPLLLNFWASWCEPCKLEAPELQRLTQKYGEKLDIYGVNVTSDDSIQEVQKFVDNYRLTFPILLDKQGSLFAKFSGVAFPTNIVIGKDGRVKHINIGLLPMERLESQIQGEIDRTQPK